MTVNYATFGYECIIGTLRLSVDELYQQCYLPLGYKTKEKKMMLVDGN